MAQLIVVYWRDIPAQVIVKAGRQTAKRELPERFIQAIDMAAMRSGAAATDDYLADWRRARPGAVRRRPGGRGGRRGGAARGRVRQGSHHRTRRQPGPRAG